jgi:hypothetical protein
MNMLQSALASAGAYQLELTETDPDFDPIRDEPRFKEMIAQARQRLGIKATTSVATH